MANTSNSEAKKFTKDCVTQAFLNLLETKNYEDISLSEIAEKAGVSRNAIYRNFHSKDMILKIYLRDLAREVAVEFTRQNIENYQDYILFLLDNLCNHKTLCKKLYNANLMHLLLQAFMLVKGRFEIDEEIKNYYENYRIGGFFSICMTWLENDCRESPVELARILNQIIDMDGVIPVLPIINPM